MDIAGDILLQIFSTNKQLKMVKDTKETPPKTLRIPTMSVFTKSRICMSDITQCMHERLMLSLLLKLVLNVKIYSVVFLFWMSLNSSHLQIWLVQALCQQREHPRSIHPRQMRTRPLSPPPPKTYDTRPHKSPGSRLENNLRSLWQLG